MNMFKNTTTLEECCMKVPKIPPTDPMAGTVRSLYHPPPQFLPSPQLPGLTVQFIFESAQLPENVLQGCLLLQTAGRGHHASLLTHFPFSGSDSPQAPMFRDLHLFKTPGQLAGGQYTFPHWVTRVPSHIL